MNHHLFQPLLYQVAAGALSPSDCASPIRPALKRSSNTTVLMAEVTDVDAERRQVVLDRGDRLDYDSLIVACGGETSYFGHDEWKDVTCGLKTLADVVDLRKRFYGAFEAGRAHRRPGRAGRVADVRRRRRRSDRRGDRRRSSRSPHSTMKRDFRRIDTAGARVILLDAGDRVVAAFSEKLSKKVAGDLDELGVTVHEGARVTAIDERGVTYEVGGESERIDTRTVIWAAGVHAVPLTDVTRPGDRGEHRPRRAHRGQPRPDGARPSRDLGDRRRRVPGGPGRQAASRARDGRDPAGPPRGQGDPRGRARGLARRSTTSTRARSRSSAAAGRSARSGASSCGAGPPSSPTSAFISTTSAARRAAAWGC